VTASQEIALAAAQLKMLAGPAGDEPLKVLTGYAFRVGVEADVHSVRADRLADLNGILDEQHEPATTFEELERVGIDLAAPDILTQRDIDELMTWGVF
jgi:hypothetical protein